MDPAPLWLSGSIVATEIVPALVTFVNSMVTGGASPASGGIGVTTVGPVVTTTGAMTVSAKVATPVLTVFEADSVTLKRPGLRRCSGNEAGLFVDGQTRRKASAPKLEGTRVAVT